MADYSNKKNKINLSDYNYQRDIENRLLMAELSVFDVSVLQEIVDGSLKMTTTQLADALEADEEEIICSLDKFTRVKLVQRVGHLVHVDKELRKYYESQMMKFDDDFEPDVEFLQGLLGKVPIHALPNWYSIPRTTDNIFTSLVENYLHTPKIYERYMSELRFEEPKMGHIVKDVFSAEDFKVSANSLINKYSLSREQFEEYMLHLEYNLVCCLGYYKDNNKWQEVVTPIHEWRTYLQFLRDSVPIPIKNTSEIKRYHPLDFGFVQDIKSLLSACQEDRIVLPVDNNEILKIIPHFNCQSMGISYIERLIETLTAIELIEVNDKEIQATSLANEWMKKSLPDQSLSVYRHSVGRVRDYKNSFLTERDIREIERNLKRVVNCDWITFDEFLKGFIAPIGNAEPITLQNKGKRWKYVLPQYTIEEQNQIKQIIFEALFEAGMTMIGQVDGVDCFNVTPFGRVALLN